MADQPVGFTFREKMSGGFAMGETDPVAGEKLGTHAGNIFTMHGTITIPDLDKFLAETSHPGSIAGTLDFVPLGTGLPVDARASSSSSRPPVTLLPSTWFTSSASTPILQQRPTHGRPQGCPQSPSDGPLERHHNPLHAAS